MTKIYLATSGEYSDYRVVGAFTRFEDAEAYELGDAVEEIELHDGPVEVRRRQTPGARTGAAERGSSEGEDAMTKIYLATSGEYSDYRVVGAFTRFEDAEAYELGDAVEEIELHDGPVEVRTWHMAWWSPWEIDFRGVRRWIDHTNRLTERRDYDGDARNASHVWQRKGSVTPRLYVQGWDIDRVDRVLSEQRVQYMAQDDVVHLVPAPGTQQ